MKCEKCNKEHPGPWPFGYTHVYCECGHELEVVLGAVDFTQPTKINGVALSGMIVSFSTEFCGFEMTFGSEDDAMAAFEKLDKFRVSGERLNIKYND